MESASRTASNRRMKSIRQSLRKKSCNQCRDAKIRCNLATPECSRCEVRGLECMYENVPYARNISPNAPRRVSIRQESSAEIIAATVLPVNSLSAVEQASTVASPDTPLLVPSCEDGRLGSPIFQESNALRGSTSSPSLDMNDFSSEVYQSNLQGTQIHPRSLIEDLEFTSIFPAVKWSSKMTPSSPQQSYSRNSLEQWTEDILDDQPSETAPIQFEKYPIYHYESWEPCSWDPQTPSLDSARLPSVTLVESTPIIEARSLSYRKYAVSTSHLSAKVVLGTLKSYPKMILEGSLPPFLHHCYFAREDTDLFSLRNRREIRFPEALANCQSILHMFFMRTKESSAFVWRTIRSEQQRLRREV
ncbi:hypothetical protein MMC14_008528 [Varicellaria rhodocarpa]|nr:hypothetical protein [Varicellaria rhodocarpa]